MQRQRRRGQFLLRQSLLHTGLGLQQLAADFGKVARQTVPTLFHPPHLRHQVIQAQLVGVLYLVGLGSGGLHQPPGLRGGLLTGALL